MDSKERNTQELLTALAGVRLPQVETPLFKAQLKAKLMAEVANPVRSAATNRQTWWRFALAAAVLLAIFAWQLMPAPLPALAYLEIEVNPSVRLTVNSRGQVTHVEALDELAKLALQEFAVRGQPAIRAVAQVLEWWHRAALLTETSEVWLIVSPIGDTRPEVIDTLLLRTQTVASDHARRLLAGTVTTHGLVVDRVRYEVARQGTLRPSQYARVARAGVSASGMQELVAAAARLQAAEKITGNHLREFMDLVAELLELGLPESEATELIESLLAKGQSTRGLAKRLEQAVERIEKGQELKEAMRELRDEAEREDDSDEADDRDEDEAKELREDEESSEDEDPREGKDEGEQESEDDRDAKDRDYSDQTEEDGN